MPDCSIAMARRDSAAHAGPALSYRCIEDNYYLLYSDRDSDPFVAHLGLRCALP
jgi:hypothetical protein